jgi:hypothetical protein
MQIALRFIVSALALVPPFLATPQTADRSDGLPPGSPTSGSTPSRRR